MNSNIFIRRLSIGLVAFILATANSIFAQRSSLDSERAFIDASENRWWWVMAFVTLALFAGAIILWIRSKKSQSEVIHQFENRYKQGKTEEDYYELGVDAEKELEWYRKAKMSTSKPKNKSAAAASSNGREKRSNRVKLSDMTGSNGGLDEMNVSSRAFQDKMRTIQFSQLPIHSFMQLSNPRPFEQLELSSDPGLISAIEQANEEFEEDESVRDLALRILAAFKTRNSVESLSQIALYDLSSNLRSRAVNTLADFDHESVFEPILLACADPTREVRAAAARGLFRLSFDRAEAWKRLIATEDEYRMRHAARAAIESGIAAKSLDRLLHEEMKIAYESVAMVGLLITSGEHSLVFDSIQNHKDNRVKLALLHVIKVMKDDRTLDGLERLAKSVDLPEDIAEKVTETIYSIGSVPA